MTTMSATQSTDFAGLSRKLLNASATTWLTIAILGQWLFAYYILVFYGGSALEGSWTTWSKRMIHGFIDGDLLGNIAVLTHILLAFVITFCGPLQLIPQVRSNFPVFHRHNGRVYIFTAMVISVAAIYSVWSRDNTIGGLVGQLGTSLDAVLIIVCAFMTVKLAMARKINLHRRWALRLFIVVSGVWFFRVMRGFWILLNDGTSPGTNSTLTGPFDMALNFVGYLLPLLVLELYFRVKDKGGAAAQGSFAMLIFVLAGCTAIGIFGAAKILWLPNI